MADKDMVSRCAAAARRVRRRIVDMAYATGNAGAHLGGSLSSVELLVSLYSGIVRYDGRHPEWEGRDRVIMSKGHAALALYPALAEAGVISDEELMTFKKDGSRLSGHPSLNGLPGIEYASGSLGQGLSIGVGVCLALRRKQNDDSRVFVFLGDGECDEGSVWEAAASASHFRLQRLVAVVDVNGIQYDGYTADVMDMAPLEAKWKAFGWDVMAVDGHDVEALLDTYVRCHEKPLAILARTVKGKGISFMEDNWRFHNCALTKDMYDRAIAELEATA